MIGIDSRINRECPSLAAQRGHEGRNKSTARRELRRSPHSEQNFAVNIDLVPEKVIRNTAIVSPDSLNPPA